MSSTAPLGMGARVTSPLVFARAPYSSVRPPLGRQQDLLERLGVPYTRVVDYPSARYVGNHDVMLRSFVKLQMTWADLSKFFCELPDRLYPPAGAEGSSLHRADLISLAQTIPHIVPPMFSPSQYFENLTPQEQRGVRAFAETLTATALENRTSARNFAAGAAGTLVGLGIVGSTTLLIPALAAVSPFALLLGGTGVLVFGLVATMSARGAARTDELARQWVQLAGPDLTGGRTLVEPPTVEVYRSKAITPPTPELEADPTFDLVRPGFPLTRAMMTLGFASSSLLGMRAIMAATSPDLVRNWASVVLISSLAGVVTGLTALPAVNQWLAQRHRPVSIPVE